MGIISIILIVLWIVLIYEGVYCIIKGHFHNEAEKVKKHEPKAYRKWIKITGVLLIISAAINIIFTIFDLFADAFDWKFTILSVVVVVVAIIIISIAYRVIVKPADEKAGIESDFSEILKNSK